MQEFEGAMDYSGDCNSEGFTQGTYFQPCNEVLMFGQIPEAEFL